MAQANQTEPRDNRHIVVVGASAGGLKPLERILGDLPADLPASILVVLHIGATSHLARVLSHSSRLPVHAARSGEPLRKGHVYVAVPGLHLLVHDSHILLRRGPRENCSRPAIDPLFRTAACTFGGAVIGVILSGALNDGAAGLLAIQHCGGLTIVQDPSEASVPSMPSSALRVVDADHVARAGQIGALLDHLVRTPAAPTPPIPDKIKLEAAIAAQELSTMKADDALGTPSRFTCPECNGTLWEIQDDKMLRFRCHVGHAYTAETIMSARRREVEDMLWRLLRTHQERAALALRMAEQEPPGSGLASELRRRANEYEEDAEVVRSLIGEGAEAVEMAGEQGAA